MLKKKAGNIVNSKKIFFKYNFYQSIFKKGKKNYFLLDFFRGLKGYFIFKNVKKFKKRNFYYKSFNIFNNNYNSINNTDYLYNDLNIKFLNTFNILKSKKKKNIFLITLIEGKNFYPSFLKNISLFKTFLNLKKTYIFSLSLKLFKTFEYLNIYYYFIKRNVIIKIYSFIKTYFINKLNIKFLNYKFYLLNNLFIFYDNNELLKSDKYKINFFYNKYNNLKNLKILFINRILKKLNKYLSNFKIYKNRKKLKWFFINLIQSLKYNDSYFFNKSSFYLKNKKMKLKYRMKNYFSNKLKERKIINGIKLNFFVNYLYRLYTNNYLNYKNKNNIILKYYFYFYNFIIKIFIKLLNNFKFIILNKYTYMVKKFIWFKIFLIFSYYRKILVNSLLEKRGNKLKFNSLIDNIKWKKKQIRNKIVTLKFNCFIKHLPEWRKKFVIEKFKFFKKNLNLRFRLIRKIKRYKKGNYFHFLKLNKLKKIYLKLNYKIGKMKYFKNKKKLEIYRLLKFIKNNKLKKRRIFKLLDIKYKLRKNYKIA